MSGHSKEGVRLCEHIVAQAFGSIVQRVASTLLNRGRLPATTVARLSGLSPHVTNASLLILLQHNLVQSNGASVKQTGEDEQYEFNVDECLLRLRWGRILAITHEKLDLVAVQVVKQLMIYGKLRVPDIVSACGGDSDAIRAEAVTNTIISLLLNRFLECTAPELQILESDQIDRRFAANRKRMVLAQGSSLLSANDLENCRLEASHDVRTEATSLRAVSNILIQKPKIDPKKKRKPANANPIDDFDFSLKENVHLRVNYDRYGVFIRNELIVKAAEDRWNKGAGVVMRAVLEGSVQDSSALRDDRTHDPVSINTIISSIPPSSAPLLLAGISAPSKSSLPDLARHYLTILAAEDQVGNGGWLVREGSTNPGYRVEFEAICVRMRESLLGDLVREKLGDKAARVLAVVTKSNKAFETTIRDCAMVSLRDARYILAELQQLSLVETQEVPKTAAKSRLGLPSSAEYHLWAVDLPRVYGVLLTSVYKALGNILQRKAAEIGKKSTVLAREQRVLGHEGGRGLLQLKDQEDLAELDDSMNKLTLAELRSELVVFILRDLPGWPGSGVLA
ncbi:hypothetical protein L202_04548 [Cryptococcus amylolentus CBS 6039]|uniref:DNA-directed RNA polymerase III subunit RPC3 n=1 Tax=Cryptococcus amylolentus CBS 6039 TaxID=1295533 RepID=A0A1E3HRS0_9TREE|nr:hypothetical protein L202_04548 [Cryptococcus amylolentus CBS 6039]ODN79044.1 hypothetical protein L202_04548 [Cryptococcus amylolentus CBS 6039]